MRLEAASSNEITFSLGHLGIVAGISKELKIAERINKRIGTSHKGRIVQPGTAVEAMIVNGLGFTDSRLYLSPLFYQDKPVELLFGKEVKAEDLNEHTLGKALDEIHAYGATKLYAEIAFDILFEFRLRGDNAHLDSTSFALYGDSYESHQEKAINIKKGYSKDNKPHLNQVMLNMVMTGEAKIPFWMEPKDGNSSDQVSFHQTIANIRSFQKQLCVPEFNWIADSSLYTKDRLLSINDYFWISRVPNTIKECRSLLEAPEEFFTWEELEDGYKITEQECSYGGIKQRYVSVYSAQAFKREQATFEKNLKKEKEELEKQCWHLGNQVFKCPEDARTAVQKLEKKYSLWNLGVKIESIESYDQKGRPKEGAVKKSKGYKITCTISQSSDEIKKNLATKGRFVLATNNLNKEQLSGALLLKQYKEQQKVEGGFKFLKDPWFLLDSFYLKKPSRIEALMMVMTLCLMIYNFAEYKLRKALIDTQETLPNQLNKEVKNPTMKWIFQQMQGITIVQFYDYTSKSCRNIITRLTPIRIKIIGLLGELVAAMYGVQTSSSFFNIFYY